MKIKIIAVLLLFGITAISDAAQVTASLLYKVKLGDKSAPADAVVESDSSTGIYDAYTGSYTVYRNGKAVRSTQKAFLKGGTCLVKSGNYFLFCNSTENTLDMLTGSLDKFSSFGASGLKGKYDPTDAVVSGGYVYSADNDNHRILKTHMGTKAVEAVVGGYGQDKLQFWYPFAMAMDKKGVLYVSEVLGTRVQKITKDFKFYEFIGQWGIDKGQFYRPTGIALLNGEILFVGDGFTGAVQYFDADGKYMGVLKDRNGKKLKFESVTHMRINGRYMAVVDGFARTVSVYELRGTK
ncbi:NHL repeat-containing protein [Seleniivibrio sp.]|uniref:NHL repeat-containing protein n=1 Tax=Seleniivibrio sp. TaxID=2898801 RepID=UPI0025D720D7|nr:NHL repeat-containing protein [Seleniivibrio sp.]MCD8554999.1 NHL repeat-containing protein [Seleniivibrio sp.]